MPDLSDFILSPWDKLFTEQKKRGFGLEGNEKRALQTTVT